MLKVLIVEDEKQLLDLLHTTLSKKYEAFDAKDGAEGLEIALKEHPDLILLDIKMPKMDGWEMLEKLRQDSWGKTAKVVMLTNLDTDNYAISHVVKEQPVAYWVKSNIKILDIADKVKKILGS